MADKIQKLETELSKARVKRDAAQGEASALASRVERLQTLEDSGAEAVEKDRARYSILADKFSKEVLSLETELAREVYQRDLAEAQEAAKLEEATLTAFSDSWDRARDALVAAVEVSASIPVDVRRRLDLGGAGFTFEGIIRLGNHTPLGHLVVAIERLPVALAYARNTGAAGHLETVKASKP